MKAYVETKAIDGETDVRPYDGPVITFTVEHGGVLCVRVSNGPTTSPHIVRYFAAGFWNEAGSE